MKRIYNFILLVCLVQLAVAQNRIAEIRENLLGNYSDRVLVVSHRADWRNAPENSLRMASTILASVAMDAWSVPGSHRVS